MHATDWRCGQVDIVGGATQSHRSLKNKSQNLLWLPIFESFHSSKLSSHTVVMKIQHSLHCMQLAPMLPEGACWGRWGGEEVTPCTTAGSRRRGGGVVRDGKVGRARGQKKKQSPIHTKQSPIHTNQSFMSEWCPGHHDQLKYAQTCAELCVLTS